MFICPDCFNTRDKWSVEYGEDGKVVYDSNGKPKNAPKKSVITPVEKVEHYDPATKSFVPTRYEWPEFIKGCEVERSETKRKRRRVFDGDDEGGGANEHYFRRVWYCPECDRAFCEDLLVEYEEVPL